MLVDCLGVPVAFGDATSLVETGYVGEHLDGLMRKLYIVARGELEAAQRGIVFIDETDKIRRQEVNSREVAGEGVQTAVAREERQGDRDGCAPQPGGVPGRVPGARRNSRRPQGAAVPPGGEAPARPPNGKADDATACVGVRQTAVPLGQPASLPTEACCHTFRATGITTYLRNGGTLEKAQYMAGHESSRTTGLYDRRHDEITLDDVERIAI